MTAGRTIVEHVERAEELLVDRFVVERDPQLGLRLLIAESGAQRLVLCALAEDTFGERVPLVTVLRKVGEPVAVVQALIDNYLACEVDRYRLRNVPRMVRS